jgi:hypothetical protein
MSASPSPAKPTEPSTASVERVVVRYTVKPEHAEENEALVRAVFRELERTQPAGLRYATFRLDDGVTFVHMASIEAGDDRNLLSELTAFREFKAGLADRCAQPPERSPMVPVGSFGWLGD